MLFWEVRGYLARSNEAHSKLEGRFTDFRSAINFKNELHKSNSYQYTAIKPVVVMGRARTK